MKRSIISLLVAGLFAGTAASAADDTNTKATPKSETSQSTDANIRDEQNNTSKDSSEKILQDSDKTAATPKQADTSPSTSTDANIREEQSNTSKDTSEKILQDSDKTAAEFRKADTDNDGTLDRKEVKKMRDGGGIAKNFDAIDAGHDGTISMEELDTYMAANPGKKGNM